MLNMCTMHALVVEEQLPSLCWDWNLCPLQGQIALNHCSVYILCFSTVLCPILILGISKCERQVLLASMHKATSFITTTRKKM